MTRPARQWPRWGVGAGVVACAVCCAGLPTLLGSIGVASVVVAIWIPALLVPAAAAAVAIVVTRHRRRTLARRVESHHEP